MKISPLMLSALLLFSFVFGAFIGVLNDTNRIVRVFFGARYSDRNFDRLRRFTQTKMVKMGNERKGFSVSSRMFDVLVFLQDMLLMCVSGVGIVILNYYFNDGRFRFFTVAAALAGFLLYYFTVGKLIMLISEPITLILRFVMYYALKCIAFPFVFVYKLLCGAICKILFVSKKKIAKRQNLRYNIKKRNEYEQLASIAFVGSDILDKDIKDREYESQIQ